MKDIRKLIKNNESIGITAELFLADMFNIKVNDEYRKRGSTELQNIIENKTKKAVLKAFKKEQINIEEHIAEGQSPHDFTLNNNKTLSVKTNKNKLDKVCPQNVGQLSLQRFNQVFKQDLKDVQEVKGFLINNIYDLINIYWENLFNSDYIFYLYDILTDPNFILLHKLKTPNWEKEDFSFKNTSEEWNNSNILKYKGKTLAEIQIHSTRNSICFRFFIKTILELFLQYKTGMISIENKDCFDFLSTVENDSVDLVLIDPPYFISRETGFANGKETGRDVDRFRLNYEFGKWDKTRNRIKDVVNECYRVLKKGGTLVCFYDLWKITELKEFMIDAKFKQLRFGEWIKTNPVPINSKLNYLTNSREIFLTGTKGSSPIFNSEYDNGVYYYPIYQGKDRIHPTQKHLSLIEDLIRKHSKQNDLILDCFLGSGTTVIACKNTKRRFIGCEKDPNYFLQMLDRIKKSK